MADVPSTAGLPSVNPQGEAPDDYQHIEEKIGPATERLSAGLQDLSKAFYNMQSTKYQSMATETVWKLRNQFNDLPPDQQVAQAPQYEAAVGKIYSYYGDQLPSLDQRDQYMQDTRSLQDRYFAGQFFTAAKDAQKNAVKDGSLYVNQAAAGNITQDPQSEDNFVSAMQQMQAARLHADVADGLIGDKQAIIAGQQEVQATAAKARIEALMVQPNGSGLALANQTLERFKGPLGSVGAYPELASRLDRLNKGAGVAYAVKGAVDSVVEPALAQYHDVDGMVAAAADVPALADKAADLAGAPFGDNPDDYEIKQEAEDNARQGVYTAWNKRYADYNDLARENVTSLQNYIQQHKVTDINSLATSPVAAQYASVPASMMSQLQAVAKQQAPGAEVVNTPEVRQNFDATMGQSISNPTGFAAMTFDPSKFTPAQMNTLEARQLEVQKQLQTGVSVSQADGIIAGLRPDIQASGIKTSLSKGESENMLKPYNTLAGQLRQQIDAFHQQNNRMPNDKEAHEMLDRLLINGFQPGTGSFFGGAPPEKPLYEILGEGGGASKYELDLKDKNLAPAVNAIRDAWFKKTGQYPDQKTLETLVRQSLGVPAYQGSQ